MKTELVFDGIFARATTTVDGGWRISFDLGNHEGEAVASLSRLSSKNLKIVVISEDEKPLDPLKISMDFKLPKK